MSSQVNLLPPEIPQGQKTRRTALLVLGAGGVVLALLFGRVVFGLRGPYFAIRLAANRCRTAVAQPPRASCARARSRWDGGNCR